MNHESGVINSNHEYGHLMLPGVFPDKVTSDIDFKDEGVVQCDVLAVKVLL